MEVRSLFYARGIYKLFTYDVSKDIICVSLYKQTCHFSMMTF